MGFSVVVAMWYAAAIKFAFWRQPTASGKYDFVGPDMTTGIKSRTSSNSGRIGSVTSKLSTLEGDLNFQ